MKRRSALVALATAFTLALSGPAFAQAKKPARPQIAVLDFEYGTVDNWWGQYDIGKGIADQLVDALVEDGSFRVIERKKLAAILGEQDFAASGRADPSAQTMAKIGKVLGVKYILVGSITKFSTESRGGGVRVKGIGLGGKKTKSEVRITGLGHRHVHRRDHAFRQGRRRVEQGRRVRLLQGRQRNRHQLRRVASERAGRCPGSLHLRPDQAARGEDRPAPVVGVHSFDDVQRGASRSPFSSRNPRPRNYNPPGERSSHSSSRRRDGPGPPFVLRGARPRHPRRAAHRGDLWIHQHHPRLDGDRTAHPFRGHLRRLRQHLAAGGVSPEYKAHRPKMDADLASRLPSSTRLAKRFGCPW